jgi:NAD(P)-dependent dehydrogenase (short-subunit alcohol dehydrogenase family)
MLSSLNPRVRDWRGRRVWIVGASSGIGAELARELLKRGARVALSARRAEPLQALAGPALAAGSALILPLDVGQPDSVRAGLQTIVDRWQGVDVVLWVAGTYRPMRAYDFDLTEAQRIVQTNLGGVLNGLASILPVLIGQRSGAIGIVSSVAGFNGLPMSLVYGPTKAALINLAQSLYFDLHPLGIGVHLINPGFVETPLTDLNEFPMPAIVTAPAAANRILSGLERGEFETHFPRRFTSAMKLLQLLPYRAYFSVVRRITASEAALGAPPAFAPGAPIVVPAVAQATGPSQNMAARPATPPGPRVARARNGRSAPR